MLPLGIGYPGPVGGPRSRCKDRDRHHPRLDLVGASACIPRCGRNSYWKVEVHPFPQETCMLEFEVVLCGYTRREAGGSE